MSNLSKVLMTVVNKLSFIKLPVKQCALGGEKEGGRKQGVIVIPVNQLLWEFPKGAVNSEELWCLPHFSFLRLIFVIQINLQPFSFESRVNMLD